MNDPASLSGWFNAHAAGLVLYARQWLDRAAAEDVVQEAFVRLMLQRRMPTSVKSWLYRTVRNAAISQWRSNRRRVAREQASATRETYFEPPAHESIDAQAAAEALQTLSEQRREVIVLRIWGELTLAEISTITGLPVSTVFHHYRQGLAAIREQIGALCRNKND